MVLPKRTLGNDNNSGRLRKCSLADSICELSWLRSALNFSSSALEASRLSNELDKLLSRSTVKSKKTRVYSRCSFANDHLQTYHFLVATVVNPVTVFPTVKYIDGF